MSLIGGNSSPYREPAGDVPFYCGEFAHETGDVLKLKYTYSAVVPNFDTTVGGTIPPYERYLSNSTCDWSCIGGTNASPCEPWIIQMPGPSAGTAAAPYYTQVGGYSSTAPSGFTAAGTNVNLAVCHKRGFKNVAAKRFWHGVFGWTSPQLTPTCCQSGTGTCYDPGDGLYIYGYTMYQYIPYISSPDNTKYLSVSPTMSYGLTSSSDTVVTTISGTASGTVSVSPDSGEISSSLLTTETKTSNGAGVTQYDVSGGYDSISHTYGWHTELDTICMADFHNGNNPIPGGTLDGAVYAFNSTLCSTLHDGSSIVQGGYSFMPQVTDLNNYSGSGSYVLLNPDSTIYKTVSSTISWSRSATTYTFSVVSNSILTNPTETIPSTQLNIHGTSVLGGTSIPGGGASGGNYDLRADAAGLLSNWMLNDDALYPWRTDGYTTVMPKVSRLEVQSNISPLYLGFVPATMDNHGAAKNGDGTYQQITWKDMSNAWAWLGADESASLIKINDGSVIGSPNPAGYQGYFQFGFIDMRGCCIDSNFDWGTYGYGGTAPDYLPKNATNWTNWFESMSMPAFGAKACYNDGSLVPLTGCSYDGTSDPAFWMVKWAEIGEPLQSINFARPAGYDKFLLDETNVYCYNSGILYQQDGITPATGLTLTGTWGGASVSGFFNGATTDGSGNVTLGAKQFSVPSDWTTTSGDQMTAFGKLRWPTAPSLLGRIMVTAVADASSNPPFSSGWTPTYQFSTAQTNFGLAWSGGSATNQEQVDIYDKTMTSLASGVTATRVSDTKFTVTTSYPTAYFVMIHGASCSPNYQYCDDYPKGDFLYLEWTVDYRTAGEITRLASVTNCTGGAVPGPSPNNGYSSFSETADALPYVACSPRVACFSPNGEVWQNGKTYALPALALDETYGSRWQGQIVWSITDPFYQTPHSPCGNNLGWAEDNAGQCQTATDSSLYYALAPMLEARSTVPSGFPALPSGITIGFNAPGSPTDAAYPPVPGGFNDDGSPVAQLTPCILAENLCASIAAGCAYNYQSWYIACGQT